MLVIEIDKVDYEVPREWKDVTLKKYCDSVKVLELMPKKLHTLTFGSKEEREKIEILSEDSLLFASFYKKWVAYWCDIPENIVGRLPVEAPEEMGVVNLYSLLMKFMFIPSEKELKPCETFDHKGVAYMMPESLKLLNGDKQPMAKATFDEFYEGVELKRIQGEIKNGNAEILPLLTAIIYRPAKAIRKGLFRSIVGYEIEAYDSSRASLRAKEFESLTMDKVWNAYFFFIQSRFLLLKNTLTSLKEEKEVEFPAFASLDGMW